MGSSSNAGRKADNLTVYENLDIPLSYRNVKRSERAAIVADSLDRFHIVAHLNKALDQVRATEAKRLAQEGYEPVLKRSRWCFLKKPKNLGSPPACSFATR